MPTAIEFVSEAYNRQVRGAQRQPTVLIASTGLFNALEEEIFAASRFVPQAIGNAITFRGIRVVPGPVTNEWQFIWWYGHYGEMSVENDLEPEAIDVVFD